MLAPLLSLSVPVPVLVVGGEGDFVRRKLTPQLSRHGLTVDGHWEWRKKAGAFPESSRVVFILTDMASHALNDAAVKEAWKRGLRVIFGGRKWALNKALLERAGFPFSTAALPSSPPKPVRAPFIPPPLPLPPPPPPPIEVPVSRTFPPSPLLSLYESVFDKTPGATNKEVYAKVCELAAEKGITSGSRRDDICAFIRSSRGIVVRGGPHRVASPVELSPVAPAPAEGGGHRGDGFGGSGYTAGLSPLPELKFERVSPAPAPAPAKGGSASPDLAAAVALLRGAMAAEGITDLSVSEKGVTFRRVVIEEGSFSL